MNNGQRPFACHSTLRDLLKDSESSVFFLNAVADTLRLYFSSKMHVCHVDVLQILQKW